MTLLALPFLFCRPWGEEQGCVGSPSPAVPAATLVSPALTHSSALGGAMEPGEGALYGFATRF